MSDAHGRSVFKTNKVNNCPVLNIYVFPYVHRDRGATLKFGGWGGGDDYILGGGTQFTFSY